VHKGGSDQAKRTTVAARKKLDENPEKGLCENVTKDQDEGISAHSRQTAQLIGWSLRSRRNEKYSVKCSAPPPTLELTGECHDIQPDN